MIQLNYRDAKPIYEQVRDGIQQLIVTGALEPNEKMLSVREMASKLAINPRTISKAYKELEENGYLYSVAEKDIFVAAHKQVQSSRAKELLHSFDEIVQELFFLSYTPKELAERMEQEEKSERGIKA